MGGRQCLLFTGPAPAGFKASGRIALRDENWWPATAANIAAALNQLAPKPVARRSLRNTALALAPAY